MNYSCDEEHDYYANLEAEGMQYAEAEYWASIENCVEKIVLAGITPEMYEREYNRLTNKIAD